MERVVFTCGEAASSQRVGDNSLHLHRWFSVVRAKLCDLPGFPKSGLLKQHGSRNPKTGLKRTDHRQTEGAPADDFASMASYSL
jgi:hypothetical protein